MQLPVNRPWCTDPTYGMMYGMFKTTLYLPDDLKRALERTARARGCSEAVVVREALKQFTALNTAPRPKLPLFTSAKGNLAEHVDEALRGFGRR
jgi:predicted transcriptional regulator